MSAKNSTDSKRQVERRPWERMEGEPGYSYRKFCVYRDLGIQRTLGKAAEALGISCNGPFQRAAARWHWRNRADAWDVSIAEKATAIAEEKTVDALQRGISALHELFAVIAERCRDALQKNDVKELEKNLPILKRLIGRQAPGRYLLDAHQALAGQRIIQEGAGAQEQLPQGGATLLMQIAVMAAGRVAGEGKVVNLERSSTAAPNGQPALADARAPVRGDS